MEELLVSWQTACLEDSTAGYYRFLNKYPNSEYSNEARARLDALKERRIFETCVKEHNLKAYFKEYPNGKFLIEAQQLQTEHHEINDKRRLITSIVSLIIILPLVFILKDDYNTYSFLSSALIIFLFLEAIIIILFDIRAWKWLHIITTPIIIFLVFLFGALIPHVDIVDNNQHHTERIAMFLRVKDNYKVTTYLSLNDNSVLNLTGKTIYITHVTYTQHNKNIIGFDEIQNGKVLKTIKIDQYFKEPPTYLDMNELVRRSRRGSTSYRTIHHEYRNLNVLDFQPYY